MQCQHDRQVQVQLTLQLEQLANLLIGAKVSHLASAPRPPRPLLVLLRLLVTDVLA